jgi:SAM-dependent methyltransferase
MISYDELAWTATILDFPDACADEAATYVRLIHDNSRIKARTLLHLGCGAGNHDFTFKTHFQVTGVDLSDRMLEIARERNPEIRYVLGDMRSVDLGSRFDAVVIPDSIDYMVTLHDLQSAFRTACSHLAPGGVLLIAGKTRETFRENNFCYTGSRNGIEITLFENNYVPKNDPSTYEATLVYLIRRGDELSVHTDRHLLGLFPQETWRSMFVEAGLELVQSSLDHLYDQFITGAGEYPMQMFVGIKPG